jgi:hypothetical protein
MVGKLFAAISVDQVARAMVSIATNGYGETIISNDVLKGIQ